MDSKAPRRLGACEDWLYALLSGGWGSVSAASPQAVHTGSSQDIEITQSFILEGTLGARVGSSKGTLSLGGAIMVIPLKTYPSDLLVSAPGAAFCY